MGQLRQHKRVSFFQQPTQIATKNSSVAPITVYTNGNKYDAKRFVFNPKYVRTFDAFLDQITMETNATCAVRRIYTPHGSRRVGKLSSIEPGGRYVAVSSGHFKKIQYGQKIDMGLSSSTTTTTKTLRKHKTRSKLQTSYEDQMNSQKTIYVHRNGWNEPPTQLFFTKKLLRSLSQVLDIVQEKITCDRAIVSLHKLNGVTIDDVKKLQPEGRYVAVEQGQRFRHCTYDHIDTGATSPRRVKLPAIKPQRGNPTGQRSRHPSNESNQEARSKARIKLPVIKQNVNDAQGFHVVYGYPDKHANEFENTRGAVQNTHSRTNAGVFHAKAAHEIQNAQSRLEGTQRSTHTGPFYASGAQQELATAIRDDKRVRVEKPLDMIPADEVEEQLDGVDYHGNRKRNQPERRVKPITRKEAQPIKTVKSNKAENVTLKPTPNTSFPTKPSIVHPRKNTQAQKKRSDQVTVPKSTVRDQHVTSQDNNMATTKRYIVTREQKLLSMHDRDGREQAKGVVHVYQNGARIKDIERENQEFEKKKRIEEWVDYTVEVKQKEEEITSVAAQMVTTALANAARTLEIEETKNSRSNNKQNKSSFYDSNKSEMKYHRVFGQ